MIMDLRLPSITGATEKEQLSQIRAYLYQLVPELQFALSTVESGTASPNEPTVSISNTNINGQAPTVDAAATFAAIKSLIIKSADIVNAYYDAISTRLDGLYVAESDFGVYAEQTSQDISANSERIEQKFESTQVIISGARDELSALIGDTNTRIDGTNRDIEDLLESINTATSRIESVEGDCLGSRGELRDTIQSVSDSVALVDTLREAAERALQDNIDNIKVLVGNLETKILSTEGYVKSGVLYTTSAGIDVYGVEVGQTVEVNGEAKFNKFAQFTSEKLAFFDQNGIEVAYISDKRLYIGQAEVTISFKIGKLVDYVIPETGDVVTKWEGGR